jgi:hypothetical protein
MGVSPKVFKAGRYGFGPSTATVLEELDYDVDASVVPHMDFTSEQGPSFRGFSPQPGVFGNARRMLELPWNSMSKWSDDPAEGERRLAELLDGTLEQEIAEWNGTWRTKALRQAAKTAPYMHPGQIKTLLDVA